VINKPAPNSPSKAHDGQAKKDWMAHKDQSTSAQQALAKKKTKQPHPGPSSLK